MSVAFIRTITSRDTADVAVFYLGRLCTEDFNEILLLCANGYGTGAMKILRGMYERVVTGRHLHSHPEDVKDFLGFYWINAYKVARAIEDVFGEGQLSAEKMAELKLMRDQLISHYEVTDCKKCATKRTSHTWSKLDFVSMARATQPTGNRIVDAYYLPMEQCHSTAASIASRLKEKEDGTITFDDQSQLKIADRTLLTAHNLLIDVLDIQREHFMLTALEEPLKKCLDDFAEIWSQP